MEPISTVILVFVSSFILATVGFVNSGVVAEADIANVPWTDYGGESTIIGWAETPTANIWYKKIGNLVFVNFMINGTSNATTASFTLPYTVVNLTGATVAFPIRVKDNGVDLGPSGFGSLPQNSDTVDLYTTWLPDVWTNSGDKIAYGQFWFEAQ